jgi:hypothetical protein
VHDPAAKLGGEFGGRISDANRSISSSTSRETSLSLFNIESALISSMRVEDRNPGDGDWKRDRSKGVSVDVNGSSYVPMSKGKLNGCCSSKLWKSSERGDEWLDDSSEEAPDSDNAGRLKKWEKGEVLVIREESSSSEEGILGESGGV